jgi:hypothetical protein
LAAVLFLFVPGVVAGLGTTTGRERGRWKEDRYAVVVARITDIADAENADGVGLHTANLHPLATLAGAIDPSAAPVLRATFYVGQPTTPASPPTGSTVLAVIQLVGGQEAEKGQAADEAFIVSDYCRFMPDNSPLVVIDGLGDRRVLETLQRLQEVRARPDSASSTRAATRPAD